MKATKKKNTNTALIVSDPVGNVVRSIVPPPSKRDVLFATAKALQQEQQEAHDIRVKHAADLEAAALALVQHELRSIAHLYPTITWHDEWVNGVNGGNNYERRVQVRIAFNGELGKKLQAVKEASQGIPYVDSVERIAKHLRERANDRSTVVDQLLADPAVKRKLAKLGAALLQEPTPAEKAAAIPV